MAIVCVNVVFDIGSEVDQPFKNIIKKTVIGFPIVNLSYQIGRSYAEV